MSRILIALLLLPGLASARGLRERCEDALLTLKPKFGQASSYHHDFDVRVVRMTGQSLMEPAKKLAEAVAENVQKYKTILREAGFTSPHYLHVLVEGHVDAVKVKDTGRSPILGFCNDSGIWTPSFLGSRLHFIGRRSADETATPRPKFILLTAWDENNHSAFDPFITAHELAHFTEPIKGSKSRLWKEARADFLAYYATGLAQVRFPDGYGNRSLVKPNVYSRRTMFLDSNKYHSNSQLFSYVLYRFAKNFGMARALAFVHWVDSQEVDKIPRLGDWSEARDKRSLREDEARQELDQVFEKFMGTLNEWLHLQQVAGTEEEIRWFQEEYLWLSNT